MDAIENAVELSDKLYKISDIVETAIHALEHINATESDCVITVLRTIEPILTTLWTWYNEHIRGL